MARMSAVVAFVLCALVQSSTVATFARERSLEKAWSNDLDATMKNPVKRVLRLLEEMRTELEHEATKDQKTYDAFMCACATNKKDKAAALESAGSQASELSSAIMSRTAQGARLQTNIAALKKQIKEDVAALKTAAAIREKASGASSTEDETSKQTVKNLNNALKVLGKHKGSSFLQLGTPEMASLKAVLEDATLKHDLMLADRPRQRRLGAPKRKAFAALLEVDKADFGLFQSSQEDDDVLPTDIAQHMLARAAEKIPAAESFLQGPVPGSYSSSSGGIFGILASMKDDFEADIAKEGKEEETAAYDSAELKRTKTEQISSAKEKLDMLEQDFADNKMALANAQEDRELATGKSESSVEFLSTLKKACKEGETAFAARSQTRSDEIKAIGEALEVLTDDDNREALAKNKALNFLQESSASTSTMQARRSKALSSLENALRQSRFDVAAFSDDDLAVEGPKARLANLAVSVQLDGFAEVKAMMDKMIVELKKEQGEEVKLKASCIKDLNTNEKAIASKKRQNDEFDAAGAKIRRRLKSLREAVEIAKASIATTQGAIEEATEARKVDKADLQETVADQQATQAILKKALKKLNAFYNKRAALIEVSEMSSTYGKTSPSPVLALLEHIVGEARALEEKAVASEASAQATYVSFVKESTGVIDKLSAEVAQKTQKAATSDAELERTMADVQSGHGEVVSLAEYGNDVHEKCDFLLKNYNARQEGRQHTMEEIENTKAILSGSSR